VAGFVGWQYSSVAGCPYMQWKLARHSNGQITGIVYYSDMSGVSSQAGHFQITLTSEMGSGRAQSSELARAAAVLRALGITELDPPAPSRRGEAYLVRFVDDFVVSFQQLTDAEAYQAQLRERFAKFNLELAEEKTRLLLFGRFAAERCARIGRRPETFEFLASNTSVGSIAADGSR
jgi:hypothetical protein